jgi:signal transduction histidine kinase
MLSADAFRTLMNALSEPVIAVDARDTLIYANSAAEQALGVERAAILDRPLADVLAVSGYFAEEGRADATLVPPPDGSRWLILPPTVPAPPTLASDRVKQAIHSLKTPLAVAKSALDLLEDEGTPPHMQAALVARAQDNLAHMRAMIDKLLYASWLESDAPIRREPTDLTALVHQQVSDLEASARSQGVSLRLVADGPCIVNGDAEQLEEAIGNLISNAIKYSTQGGEVRITVDECQGMASVRVQDQGIGIPPDDLPHVFEQFYRVQTPETRRIKGSGLGLPIAKAIAERHGGALLAQSEPRVGSTFTLMLPAGNSS